LDAAIALITSKRGADVSMAEIAKAAEVSRQAVYLHFADRAELMVSLARRLDETLGIDDEIRKIDAAGTGVDALRMMVSLQARLNPAVWAVASAADAVRRTDPDAEQAWQDRLQHRLEGSRAIIGRMRKEGSLREGMEAQAAADILWNITSLHTWEDLVLTRGWSPQQYEKRITALLLNALVRS
jgi:AcrR family transcriptional regulator